jgi:uncharacterized protein with ParB-like and HNH nuclease domain
MAAFMGRLTVALRKLGTKNHFIGSIVTVPAASVPQGIPKYLLIDGQQRLTTIFLLLAVLRDLALAGGENELAREIQNTLLVHEFKSGDDHFRLMPTKADRAVYRRIIKAEPSDADSSSKLMGAYQYFKRAINQAKVGVEALKDVIISRLSMVSITLDPDDNPYLVFESLNAKGSPLTQADLIRNYFFMSIHVDQQDETNAQYWEPMQNALGDSLTEYIRHYLMRNGSVIKKLEVYFNLKERVKSKDALESLKDLHRFADYYARLIKPENEKNVKISRSLQRLKRFDVTTVYPFLLNCYDDYQQTRISANDYVDILQAVENYVLRRWVCNYRTSDLNKIFPSLYQQASQFSTSLVLGVRQALAARGYPRDAEFRKRLLELPFYRGDGREKTSLLLEAIEAYYGHKETVDLEGLTIEHVMPQTLSDWWRAHLGAEAEADHETYVHRLGNLTLTAYNGELSNAPFTKKREIFRVSQIEMNRYFNQRETWNGAEIEARSEALAERLLSIYPYLFGTDTPTDETDGITGSKPRSVHILGQHFPANTWVDVLERTLNVLADLEAEKFEQSAKKYPRLLNRDRRQFRRSRQLQNGYCFETNRSARDVHRFCEEIVLEMGLSNEDWRVEY